MWTFFVWLIVVYISERRIDSHPDVVIHSQPRRSFSESVLFGTRRTEFVCILWNLEPPLNRCAVWCMRLLAKGMQPRKARSSGTTKEEGRGSVARLAD
jgi:hypothetical protein